MDRVCVRDVTLKDLDRLVELNNSESKWVGEEEKIFLRVC